MDGLPVLDYTPEGLLGLVVLLILFGRLVPYTVVKAKDAEIASWKAAFQNEQTAHAETIAQRGVEQKALEPVRRVFEEGT